MQRNENKQLLKVIALIEVVIGLIILFTFDDKQSSVIGAVLLWGLAMYSLYHAYRQKE